jgi:hypothetical protein
MQGKIQENYFESIESEFSRLRGKNSLLSPLEWQLVEQWENSEIPCRLVIDTMRKVFKNRSGINSLRYFEPVVAAKFKSWKQSNPVDTQQDQAEPTEDQNLKQEYFKVLSQLIELYSQPSLPPWAGFVKSALKKVDKKKTLSEIEDQMKEINKKLSNEILKDLSKEDKIELVASYKGFQIKKHRYGLHNIKEKIIFFEVLRSHGLKEITLYQL